MTEFEANLHFCSKCEAAKQVFKEQKDLTYPAKKPKGVRDKCYDWMRDNQKTLAAPFLQFLIFPFFSEGGREGMKWADEC